LYKLIRFAGYRYCGGVRYGNNGIGNLRGYQIFFCRFGADIAEGVNPDPYYLACFLLFLLRETKLAYRNTL
jgi:hypothetical protein